MRVLVLTNDFPTPADPQFAVFIQRQLEAIRSLGHEIEIFRVVPLALPLNDRWRRYTSIPAHYEYAGFSVRTIRALYPPRMIGLEYLHLQVRGRLHQAIRRFAPDVLHAHFILPAGVYAVENGVPVVITSHGSDAYDWPWRRRGLERAARRVLRHADAVVAVSRFVGSCVERLGGAHVQVVMNGADERIFHPTERAHARAALGIAPDRLVVTYAGYLIPAKGVVELANAMAMLRDLHPLLLVAGQGPELARVQSILRDAGVEVHYAGVVGQARVAQLIAAGDVVALPSYEEGLPAVLCEAMLMGRAIVATPVGGITEIVDDGVTGRIVPVRDERALAAALRGVLTDPARRDSFEAAARTFAATHLTWRSNAAEYDRIYHEIAER
jgi:teichuronic acid biosynthesis glycosyltransferase TuaC